MDWWGRDRRKLSWDDYNPAHNPFQSILPNPTPGSDRRSWVPSPAEIIYGQCRWQYVSNGGRYLVRRDEVPFWGIGVFRAG